jgi:Flp pilus assembly protein TadG
VALSLVGLIAAGGIAFDYARLATMDTELQQAADQAALAAVTQLDRSDDSIDLATAAIQDGTGSNRLAANLTKFANDSEGTAVELDSIVFCSDFDDSVADTDAACDETTDANEARYVWVKTSLRTANYALTPIAGALAGTSHAEAVAGVESSICHIAPLFVCTDDEEFPADDDIGRGLVMKTGAKNSWFPGNYGYLDFGPGNPGVVEALLGHGLNGCQPIDESNTQPGNKNATDAINTRFDVYGGTGATKDPAICTDLADGGSCPDRNSGKDLTMTLTYAIQQKTSDPAPTRPKCGIAATPKSGNPNPSAAYTPFALNSNAKGMPRDSCHYAGNCTDGNFGDKIWNATAYMTANHPGVALADVPHAGTSPTRYEVYHWELLHYNDADVTKRTLEPREVGPINPPTTKVNGANTTYTYTMHCAFPQPREAKGAAEGERRILPVLAAKCEGLNGASDLDAFQSLRVFNVFLTEPSMNRSSPGTTDDKEIYGEIVGPATTIESGSGFQYYSRNRPYLVR